MGSANEAESSTNASKLDIKFWCKCLIGVMFLASEELHSFFMRMSFARTNHEFPRLRTALKKPPMRMHTSPEERRSVVAPFATTLDSWRTAQAAAASHSRINTSPLEQ